MLSNAKKRSVRRKHCACTGCSNSDTARPLSQTHRQDRLQYTAPQLASAQCNNVGCIVASFSLQFQKKTLQSNCRNTNTWLGTGSLIWEYEKIMCCTLLLSSLPCGLQYLHCVLGLERLTRRLDLSLGVLVSFNTT